MMKSLKAIVSRSTITMHVAKEAIKIRCGSTAGLSRWIRKMLLALFLIPTFFPCHAQIVDDKDARQIVHRLAMELVNNYPFPEISAKYSSQLFKGLSDNSYSGLNGFSLAQKLNSDLTKIHKDVHLQVQYNEALFRRLTSPQDKDNGLVSAQEALRRANYGFKSVEIDAVTSTAYVNIPGPFYARQEAFETAAAAMNLTAYCKYVIIDIRSNPGGSGEMGRFLASYFYEAGNEHFYLNGFFKDRTKDVQEWTYSYVPGKRNPGAKVYILVGRGTGSAAEGFAYAMQKLHRATIVGDTTAGAGIAGGYAALANNLVVFLPFKMVVGPNSNVGWEGIGVIPDSLTSKEDALDATRMLILNNMLKLPESPKERDLAQWLLEDRMATASASAPSKKRYKKLAGTYSNNLAITNEGNCFIWNIQEPGQTPKRFIMKEVMHDIFAVIDISKGQHPSSSRIYLNRNANGRIRSLTRKTRMNDGSIHQTHEEFLRQD